MSVGWKETVYGKVSSDYVETRLRDLCVSREGIQTGPFGSQLHQRDYVPIGTPIVTVEHIGENTILHENLPHVSDDDKKRLSRYLLRTGDIVFSRVGAVDRRALVKESEDGWLFSGRCLRIRPDPKKIDSRYLSYFFGLPVFKEYIRSIAVGATMPSLNTSLLSEVPVIHPPSISEQRAIAHILGTLDDKIKLLRRMSETLEEMARAIFKAWFVDFVPVRAKMEGRWKRGQSLPGLPAHLYDLFPDRLVPSELGEIPEGWRVGVLGDLANVTSGKRPNKTFTTPNPEASIPLWGGNGPMAYVSQPLFTQPILLTGRVGTLGSVFRISSPSWPSDNTLVVLPHKRSYFEYLYFAMKRIDFDALNRGSTQPLLTQTDLKTHPIVIPDESALSQFHQFTSTLFARVDLVQSEAHTLAALRDALLPKLIRGEIRVKDAEKFLERAGV